MPKVTNRNISDQKSFFSSQSKSGSAKIGNNPKVNAINSSNPFSVSKSVNLSSEKLSVDPRHEQGISSESPEILGFFDFIPVYDDQGNLNKIGNVLQVKQDGLLATTSQTLMSTKFLDFYDAVISSAKRNKDTIENFSEDFGKSVHDILTDIVSTSNKFDCRADFSKEDFDSLKKNYIYDTNCYNFVEFLEENRMNVIKWTSTKTWIHLCAKLKNVLAKGSFYDAIASNGSTKKSKLPSQENPYAIDFSEDSIKSSNFSRTFDRSRVQDVTLVFNDEKNIIDLLDSISFLTSNIFSFKLFDSSVADYEIFSRLVYLVCREISMSRSLKEDENMLEVLKDYNYVPLKNNKYDSYDIWDYLIGKKLPQDITDFSTSPSVSGGKSLLDLCMIRETDGDVLTFEDRFIKDDVGRIGSNPIKIPGTYYYLEDILDASGKKFDLSRMKRFIDKLNSSIRMLESVLSVSPSTMPYFSPELTISSLASPAYVLSMIEKKVFSGTDLEKQKYISANSPEWKKYQADISKASTENQKIESLKNEIAAKKIKLDKDAFFAQGLIEELNYAYALATLAKIDDPTFTFSLGTYSTDEDGRAAAFSAVMAKREQVNQENEALKKLESQLEEENQIYATEENDIAVDEKKLPQDVSHLLISMAIEEMLAGDYELFSLLFARVSMISGINASDSTYIENVSRKISDKVFKLVTSTTGKESSSIPPASIPQTKIYESLVDFSDDSTLKLLRNISSMLKEIHSLFAGDKFFITAPISNPKNPNFVEKDITLYSGVQKTSLYFLLFVIMCYSVHLINPERIVGIHTASFSDIGVDSYTVQIVSEESLAKDKLRYKKLIRPECIKFVNNSNKINLHSINYFRAFLYLLKNKLDNYKNSLEKGSYNTFFQKVTDLIEDPSLTKKIVSREQLSLINCGLYDVSKRSNIDYVSPVKQISPYFDAFQDDKDVESLLPIEDTHLVSWNLLIKKFFNKGEFRDSDGFNKKIMSIGIPSGLQRSLLINESNINAGHRNGVMRINLYREDSLYPDIFHEPISFLFDMNRFPTRNLSSFSNFNDIYDPSSPLDINFLPSLEVDPHYGEIKLVDSFFQSFGSEELKKAYKIKDESSFIVGSNYTFLEKSQLEEIHKNHITSFLLEEYLCFISHVHFDEQKYYKYSPIKKPLLTQHASFLLSSKNKSNNFRNSSQKNLAVETSTKSPQIGTFLVDDVSQIQKSLITPRKFDRVFHVIFDPDDFYINVEKTNMYKVNDLRKKGILMQDSKGWKRTKSFPGSTNFDKYFVAIETYDDSVTSPTQASKGNLFFGGGRGR